MAGFSNGGSGTSSGSPVANVVTYGADPTGVADSTTAIQNAINSITNGGDVYFPNGTYKVTSTLNIGNGTGIAAPLISTLNGSSITTLNGGSATTPFTLTVVPANQKVYNGGSFATGGGTLQIWLASLVSAKITYTAYNPSTGAFTGCLAAPNSTLFTSDGTYNGSNIVTQGSQSTTHGIRLIGEGYPGPTLNGFLGLQQDSVQINYLGPGLTNCININGPMQGWGIENLFINISGTGGGIGVYIVSASFGEMNNVTIDGGSSSANGIYSTAIPGFVVGGVSSLGAAYGNSFTNITGNWVSDFASLHTEAFMNFNGDQGGLGYSSANSTFCSVENLAVAIGGVAAGNYAIAVACNFCDDISFNNVVINEGPTSGTNVGVQFNYNDYPGGYCPFNCHFNNVYFGTSIIRTLGTVSTSTSPNRFTNVRSAGTNPAIPGVYWQPGGYTAFASGMSSGTSYTPCWYQSVSLTVPVLGGASGGNFTLQITSPSGTTTTLVSAVAIPASATEQFTITVPANFTVKATLTGTVTTSTAIGVTTA